MKRTLLSLILAAAAITAQAAPNDDLLARMQAMQTDVESNIEGAKAAIEAGADINLKTPGGRNLHWATYKSLHKPVVEEFWVWLADRGIDGRNSTLVLTPGNLKSGTTLVPLFRQFCLSYRGGVRGVPVTYFSDATKALVKSGYRVSEDDVSQCVERPEEIAKRFKQKTPPEAITYRALIRDLAGAEVAAASILQSSTHSKRQALTIQAEKISAERFSAVMKKAAGGDPDAKILAQQIFAAAIPDLQGNLKQHPYVDRNEILEELISGKISETGK